MRVADLTIVFGCLLMIAAGQQAQAPPAKLKIMTQTVASLVGGRVRYGLLPESGRRAGRWTAIWREARPGEPSCFESVQRGPGVICPVNRHLTFSDRGFGQQPPAFGADLSPGRWA